MCGCVDEIPSGQWDYDSAEFTEGCGKIEKRREKEKEGNITTLDSRGKMSYESRVQIIIGTQNSNIYNAAFLDNCMTRMQL